MTQLVLLAEEDLIVREQLARALRVHGYQVIAVRDGLGLCDYLELARFSNGRAPNPDCIVSDVELSGYGGAAICQQLSIDQSHIPFILLGTGELPENSGAANLVQKPVNPEVLIQSVMACLANATPRREEQASAAG